ncbi:anthrone oxygenase family protein [Streptomyces sp. NPDC007083]|uniref:anthrone oxygenase family protein n=1 Tax=unclassified Streptomyces TaxID=2593676 RepID=UPI0033C56997
MRVDAVLGVAVLLGSGVTAGVLFAVALSVLPALFAMETGTYVHAHKLLGRNWDPTMPVVVLTSTGLAVALALIADDGAARGLFAAAAVLLLGVSAVSHLCNVPINRRVKAVADPRVLPADWEDPRPLWRRWHLLRTALAVAALLLNAVAVTAL